MVKDNREAGDFAPVDLNAARKRQVTARKVSPRARGRFAGQANDLDDAATEVRAADRFIAREGQNIRHVRDRGWHVWDGNRWCHDPASALDKCAESIRQDTVEAAASGDHDRLKAAMKMEAKNRIAGALALAEVRPACHIKNERDLDSHPFLVVCTNGTVDLRTGELRPSLREDLITQALPHAYDPGATCPTFERFLSEVMADRDELVSFLRRWFGYCLTGSVREHALVMAVGGGCNGKTVLFETIKHVMGDELAATAPPRLLLARNMESHPTELQRLKGKRLVVTNEVPKGAVFDEERIKELTGGSTQSARGMREDFSDFNPVHKLALCANDWPRTRDNSDGFWRRMRVVPFDVSFLGREDKTLGDTLKSEAQGILAWCVRGAAEWYAQGLGEPAVVREATGKYRDEEDALGRYLKHRESQGQPMAQVKAAELHADLSKWLLAEGARSFTEAALGRELTARKFQRKRTSDGMTWDLRGPAQQRLDVGM